MRFDFDKSKIWETFDVFSNLECNCLCIRLFSTLLVIEYLDQIVEGVWEAKSFACKENIQICFFF